MIVALISSCGSPGLGDRFTLRLGSWVTIEGEGFRLAYESVRDERCPRDGQCAQAGRAIVTMSYVKPPENTRGTFMMDAVAPRPTVIEGYRIDVLDLSPNGDFLTMLLNRNVS
ncbi:hypothetical protein [Amycolatopsis sp. cmx-11-12]|uniref:hypothetical protein n=1 Tax=Amycolatopsis sp. cmx-11-12 TaxID=2785795 RepID=UPI0039185699